jgi:hypothetical protein
VSAASRFMTAPLRLGRFFDGEGEANYVADEGERLQGRGAKRSERAMSKSRRRGAQLQFTYALTLCLSVLALTVQPASDAATWWP